MPQPRRNDARLDRRHGRLVLTSAPPYCLRVVKWSSPRQLRLGRRLVRTRLPEVAQLVLLGELVEQKVGGVGQFHDPGVGGQPVIGRPEVRC